MEQTTTETPTRETHNVFLTGCEISVFITREMRDEDPEQTQDLFNAVEQFLDRCQAIADRISYEYPLLLRVEVRG